MHPKIVHDIAFWFGKWTVISSRFGVLHYEDLVLFTNFGSVIAETHKTWNHWRGKHLEGTLYLQVPSIRIAKTQRLEERLCVLQFPADFSRFEHYNNSKTARWWGAMKWHRWPGLVTNYLHALRVCSTLDAAEPWIKHNDGKLKRSTWWSEVAWYNIHSAPNTERTKTSTDLDGGYCQLLLSWTIDYQLKITAHAAL